MTRYGQFCPVAKATEIIGDPWTLLIVRELLLGNSRFSTLQQGLPRISPTVLAKRLRQLESSGLIVRRRLDGRRSHQYYLTAPGRELSGVVEAMAIWGMRWAREKMEDDEVDVTFLMFDVQRRIDTALLPDGETVLCFQFTDVPKFKTWWLICKDGAVDLCDKDPGKDVHCYITSTARTLISVWMGDLPLAKALRSQELQVIGEKALQKSLPRWFQLAIFAGTPRPGIPGMGQARL